MTTNTNVQTKAARRKLNLLELAGELENVSKACKIMGYSRQQFYEIRRDFQTYGVIRNICDSLRLLTRCFFANFEPSR